MTPGTQKIAFTILCALQLGAAASGIARYERALSQGTKVLFKVAPVDPADPFRGRYVQLSFDLGQNAFPIRGEATSDWNEPGFAVLHTDASGFAVIDYVTKARPSSGVFIEVGLGWAQDGNTSVQLPFDRYYMEESLAPAAESAYRETARRVRNDTELASRSYAIVRVLDGTGVLEGVVLDGEPLEKAAGRHHSP